MKPHFYNYIVAHYGLIIAQGGGIIAVFFVSVACAPAITSSLKWPFAVGIFCSVLAAYALGAIVAMIMLTPIVGGIIIKIQGGPFCVGDQVMILKGRRRGKITAIYEVWESRGQVRLRLSDDEAQTVADVYSMCEIMKIKTLS